MKRSRLSEEQIPKVLKGVEEGEEVKTVYARHNISEGTYFRGSGIGESLTILSGNEFNRTTYYKASKQSADGRALRDQIIDLSDAEHRRVTALIRGNGKEVTPKRVQRGRHQEGLEVRKRQRRARRSGRGAAERHRASHVNEVWSWDFVHDMTENGSRFRVLSLINE